MYIQLKLLGFEMVVIYDYDPGPLYYMYTRTEYTLRLVPFKKKF